MRYVICVLPCPARERRAGEASEGSWIERWLVVVAGESAPIPESQSEEPVVARQRPNDDRRGVRGESGRTAVKELNPSSRASGCGQCSVLETSTAADSVVRRKGTRIALYLEPDRFDLQFSTKELTHDVQAPSMLSMLKPRRVAWYLVGGADLRPFFVCSDEPGAISVRADVDWSGNEMTCRATSAGAVQLESHEIEAWSMIQQMVLLSSAESEPCAVDAPNVDRRETLRRRRNHAGPARIPRLVPKTWLSKRSKLLKRCQIRLTVNKMAKCTRKTKEKLLGAQKAAIAHESRKFAEEAIAAAEFAFASPREPPDKISPGQDTLEKERRCQAA